MKRRGWIIGLAAFLWQKPKAMAVNVLTPLDEAGFRSMVAGHHGKVLLVDFWATWCAPCREEMPKLVNLFTAQKRRGFDLVTISCDEPEQEVTAAQFVDQQGAPGPRYIRRAKGDDDFINAIDPKWSGALPALFLFDRQGKQVQSFIGETDMRQFETAIEKRLSA
jgi:thiol-disulfide isomerase/thioredoxin